MLLAERLALCTTEPPASYSVTEKPATSPTTLQETVAPPST